MIVIVVFGSDLEQKGNRTKPVSKRLQDRMHRLRCLRFWLLHSVNSIHSYLVGQMLQVLSTELERSIEQARDLSMLIKGKGSLFVNASLKRHSIFCCRLCIPFWTTYTVYSFRTLPSVYFCHFFENSDSI